MNDFIKTAFNEEFRKIECSILKEKKTINVYIENDADSSLWRRLFLKSGFKIEDFEIVPNKNKETGKIITGKPGLYKLLSEANKANLIAIDSDYDYLSPNRINEKYNYINNKFVLKTYLFSRETLLSSFDNIDCIFNKIWHYNIRFHDSDFVFSIIRDFKLE